MRIAVLGGSFDPPHNGHLLVATEILKTQAIDEIWLMPCYTHPFAKNLSKPEHRLAMTKLLEQDKIITNEVEITRNSTSYTINTLHLLQKKHPDHTFSWIIGSDQIASFPKWKNWESILKKNILIIYPRHASNKQILDTLNKTIPKNLQKHLTLLKSPKVRKSAISSSLIREGVAEGKSIKQLVPQKIDAYIMKYRLYQ